MPIREMETGLDEVSEQLREANETGAEIADDRESQKSALEGFSFVEAKDEEALAEARETAHEEAQEDFEDRVREPLDEAAAESQEIQATAQAEASETQEGVSRLDQAGDAADYGASAIEAAASGARETVDQLEDLREDAARGLEEAFGEAAVNEARL